MVDRSVAPLQKGQTQEQQTHAKQQVSDIGKTSPSGKKFKQDTSKNQRCCNETVGDNLKMERK